MSVRVVARIRPLLKSELDKDTIVTAECGSADPEGQPTIVRIPNPKNVAEEYSFQFNSVYGSETTQQDIFDKEVSPTVKHLLNGFDVTLFAYGVTGTGKTHTMRGGKALADRGVIPRLLSAVYRRSRKLEKDSKGDTHVAVSMSYYEIYNDKVFDLFEPPEKRTQAGLPLRDNGSKTIVVGLTERPCESLKEFEKLYDQANMNRSTSATKLNAHSSRSHAILCVKVSVTTGEHTRTSMASAIDLAGSEDNRRTENGKERLVESASINKSLFVLAQCVEAISKKQARIPYRESKMTRILSLGQNNGLTIMILNLAPVKSYHLDTLSSLNFANRTKKIEVREIENEPVFKGCSRPVTTFTGSSINRQPLRALATTAHNTIVRHSENAAKPGDKPVKAFSVYSDVSKPRKSFPKRSSPLKRPPDALATAATRPMKIARHSPVSAHTAQPVISKATIENIIEKKVEEILAARALETTSINPGVEISNEVKRRLELLERKIEDKGDERSEGLTFILLAKQHYVRGELSSALKMYEMAQEHFPDNSKLEHKIAKLRQRLLEKRKEEQYGGGGSVARPTPHTKYDQESEPPMKMPRIFVDRGDDDDYQDVPSKQGDDYDYESEDGFRYKSKAKMTARSGQFGVYEDEGVQTPRTKQLLSIINTRDVVQIKLLRGVGVKKAEAIVEALCCEDESTEQPHKVIASLEQLGQLRGVGTKTVENMRMGIAT